MSNAQNEPEFLRRLCELHGLTRALELFPGGVQAAAERGGKALGDLPAGNSPIMSPAPIFNPAHFEREK